MSEVRVNNLSNENNTGGPTISGITTYSGRHFFVPPSGTTAERPEDCEPGSLRFNTDTAHLEYFRGNTIGWTEIEAEDVEMAGAATSGSIDGKGTRAIFAGGYTPSAQPNSAFNNVDALTIDTLGNSIDFNNLSSSRGGACQFSDSTRAIAAGGVGPVISQYSTIVNTIEFCTFASQADYANFGDLTRTMGYGQGLSNKVRGIVAGGTYDYQNVMDYVTIQSTGDAVDFGDLSEKNGYPGGFCSSTRGFIMGGLRVNAPDTASYNAIEIVTTSTTGNATDFGDMLYANYEMASASNATRGIKAGGYGPNYTYRMEFVTMASTGNSVYFGELTGFNGTGKGGASSPTRFVLGGGYGSSPHFLNTIEFVQFATTGDSADFGDFQGFGRRLGTNGTSNNHGGLSG